MGPLKLLLDFSNKPYDDTIRHNFDHQSENDGSTILFPVPLLYKIGSFSLSQPSKMKLKYSDVNLGVFLKINHFKNISCLPLGVNGS